MVQATLPDATDRHQMQQLLPVEFPHATAARLFSSKILPKFKGRLTDALSSAA
ncbi:MAG: hypothetical protein ACI8W7_002691 [Gammaproteobacteria bacterium]|jgi:hypothetical protein